MRIRYEEMQTDLKTTKTAMFIITDKLLILSISELLLAEALSSKCISLLNRMLKCDLICVSGCIVINVCHNILFKALYGGHKNREMYFFIVIKL